MNTINTVGDLMKALSAYDQTLPLAVYSGNGIGPMTRAGLGTDEQVYSICNCDPDPVPHVVRIDILTK